MTLNDLIHNCYRLQSAMDMHYLDDLDPVIHLSYKEAMEVHEDTKSPINRFKYGIRVPYNSLDLTPPVPGTFWYMCYGIRTFVERVEE